MGFARFDGTVVAIVPPGGPACAEENGTRLVVQVQIAADVYRMVIGEPTWLRFAFTGHPFSMEARARHRA